MTIDLPEESLARLRFLIFTIAIVIGFDKRLIEHLRRAADVEGAHGQLGTRFTDRLGGDYAHRLAHVDRRPAGKIAAVALGAHPELRRAGQHRADAQFREPDRLDFLDMLLENLVAGGDDELARNRIFDLGWRRCGRAPSRPAKR